MDPPNSITDVDDSSLTSIGVAITSASTTDGYWEYSTDSEVTWTSVPSVSETDALLLDMSATQTAASVRYQSQGSGA